MKGSQIPLGAPDGQQSTLRYRISLPATWFIDGGVSLQTHGFVCTRRYKEASVDKKHCHTNTDTRIGVQGTAEILACNTSITPPPYGGEGRTCKSRDGRDGKEAQTDLTKCFLQVETVAD